MAHASVPRARVILGAVALVSSISCKHEDQQQLADQEALIAALAPDVATVYVNFSCGADTTFGLFYDAPGNQKKPAWGVMRRRGNPISWVVAQNTQPVTITSIGDKAGEDPFPITVDQNEHGGSPGAAFKATVKPDAGVPGPDPSPSHPKDRGYYYSIGVTCTPATGPAIHVVIDPEMIVRRP